MSAPYMTVIPDRKPQMKAHLTLGEAKKAVLFRLRGDVLRVPCKVYIWENTDWTLRWEFAEGTKRADLWLPSR